MKRYWREEVGPTWDVYYDVLSPTDAMLTAAADDVCQWRHEPRYDSDDDHLRWWRHLTSFHLSSSTAAVVVAAVVVVCSSSLYSIQ